MTFDQKNISQLFFIFVLFWLFYPNYPCFDIAPLFTPPLFWVKALKKMRKWFFRNLEKACNYKLS